MLNKKIRMLGVFDRKNLGLFVILACVLMQMFDWGVAYRTFAYLNVLMVLIWCCLQFKKNSLLKNQVNLYPLLLVPLAFIIMHFLAVQNLVIIKEIRHIFVALFLTFGIWILSKSNPHYIKNNMFIILMAVIISYVMSQAIALWYFKQPHGTTKNPHYLGLYSALLLIAAVYCFLRAANILKPLIVGLILCLGAFVLHSSSRPAWIGLVFSGFLVLLFVNKRARVYFGLSILVILTGLTLANVGNFASRSSELLGNLTTEERVVIWKNTWQMQSVSAPKQWLFGHGLNSFETDFKPYSYYHLQNIDFNSPHNFVLELLYLSGVIGLALVIAMFWIIYKRLFELIKNQTTHKSIYLLLLAVLTTNLVLVSITLPFFTGYNLNMIGLIVGVMLYLNKNGINTHG